MQHIHLARLAVLALGLLGLAACSPLGTKFGPVSVDVPMEGGTLDTTAFAALPDNQTLTTTVRIPFCSIPTEQEVVDNIPEVGGIDVRQWVHLTDIDIVGMALYADEGDFGFVREIVVKYVPKLSLDSLGGAVEIGRASSPTGFGDTIELVQTEEVDFLELIRENEDNPFPGCPQLEVAITGARAGDPIVWSAAAAVDIYGVLRP